MRFAVLAILPFLACAADETSAPETSRPASKPVEVGRSTPGTPEAGLGSSAPPPAPTRTTVSMFVGIGHEGRTTISCDDGKTWIANRSDDDTLRCFDPTDCDHNGKAGRGIAVVNGFFVANFGWGAPGTIRRSRDGATWSTVDEGSNFASMIAGKGKLVAASGSPQFSVDLGATWTKGADPSQGARRGGFGGTGLFVMVDDGPKAATSPDGMTWTPVAGFPGTCARNIQWSGGVSGVAGAIVIAGGDGVICTSPDDGRTWSSRKLAEDFGGELVKVSDELLVWGRTADGPALFRSKNGVDWTTTRTILRKEGKDGAGPPIGPVAGSPGGTFVAANSGWQVWYEKQRFYRSADATVWEELPSGTFAPSHPMTHMIWGEGAPSAVCPL